MQVRCAQCGASLTVSVDTRLLPCPYCSTELVVDGEGSLFHEVVLPTVQRESVAQHLRRFLAGDATVAGLDREATLAEPKLEFFPFWGFTVGSGASERVLLMPAAPSSLQGLHGLRLPGGETRPAQRELFGDAEVIDPEVPVTTAREWLSTKAPDAQVQRTALYHVPLWRVDYTWRSRTFHAAVEGVTGAVLPSDYPAKSEAPYRLVAAAALVVFGLEGLVVSNLLAKGALYLISALPLLAVAWWVTRKV